MGLTFTKANEVHPGEIVRSTDYNLLARAVNDRLLSGVADACWRIIWEVFGLITQIRNPTDLDLPLGSWPYADEWLRLWGLLKSNIPWPESQPGQPEGINLNNPLGWFTYGVDPLGDESDRFSSLTPFSGGTLADAWEVAKSQRGAFDPVAVFGKAPALEVGRAHYSIHYPAVVSFLKTYGSFAPSRRQLGLCGTPSDAPEVPLVEVFFTPTEPNPRPGETTKREIKTYRGFCPPGSDEAVAGTLVGIGYGRDYYYLYGYDSGGAIVLLETISATDYIEGPYKGGGVLEFGVGEQLEHALNNFVKDFRGSEAERPPYPARWNVKDISFDFQTFFKTQYYLSPSFGVKSGTDCNAEYPEFEFLADTDKNTRTGSYNVHNGFVIAGYFVSATHLKNPVTIEISDNLNWKSQVTLTPNDSGYAEALVYFEGDEVKQRFSVGVTLRSDLRFDGSGTLRIELAELWNYKPSVDDAYVLIRLASTKGGEAENLDTYGRYNPEKAKAIWSDYRQYGCITNGLTSALPIYFSETDSTPINWNPIHEAARLLQIENVRLAPIESLAKYEVVTVGGKEKSVLYYKRDYLFSNSHIADTFDGIGPDRSPVDSGKLVPNVVYEVQGPGTLTYMSTGYHDGDLFTAQNLHPDYTATVGTLPFQKDGILATAPPRGTSNRWCCFLSGNMYEDDPNNDNSLFRPWVYDQFIRLHQRCHTFSTDLERNSNVDLGTHFAPALHGNVNRPIFYSEAPPGYIYARGINKPKGGRNSFGTEEEQLGYYKSCQIYTAPYEIESCTNVMKGDPVHHNGEDWVRIQLNQRLRHNSDWTGALADEPYRTDENAVKQYIASNCPRIIGDNAPWPNNNPRSEMADNPKGSCYLRLYLIRLIPEVYADVPVENDKSEPPVDTRVLVDAFLQMEKYGRAMCEGFIDAESTVALQDCSLTDQQSYLMDYTAENWYFHAFGQKWIPALPVAIAQAKIKGYGPFPAQIMYAEIFNCFAKAFNLLTRARVELPFKFEFRSATYIGQRTIIPDDGGSGPWGVFLNVVPPSPDTVQSDWSDWIDVGSSGIIPAANKTTKVDFDFGSSTFIVTTSWIRIQYRFQLEDPNALLAVPDLIQPLIQGGSSGFLAAKGTTTEAWKATQIAGSPPPLEPCEVVFTGWDFKQLDISGYQSGPCEIFTTSPDDPGEIDVPTPLTADHFVGINPPRVECNNQSDFHVGLNFGGVTPSIFITVPLV